MLTLYIKTGCPYCLAVLGKVNELGITVVEKNIADENNVRELIEKGGKRQVPYLIDDACGVSMYESADIIEYLNKKCGVDPETDQPTRSGEEAMNTCPTA